MKDASERKTLQLSQVIKMKRKKEKISQKELAEMLNVSRNTIVNWETGKSKPDYSLIPELCSLLGIRLYELFGTDPDNGLSPLELRIISNLRLLSLPNRRVVDRMVRAMLDEELRTREDEMKNTYRLVMVRPGAAAAGTGEYVPEEAPSYVFLRQNALKIDGIVRVCGDSMEPVYHNGDYVYYRNSSTASAGEDVIVDTDDGTVIKRMDMDHKLYSVNPDLPYPNKNDQNTLVIRGRVLGTVHSSEYAPAEDVELLEELFSGEIRDFNISWKR